MFRRFGWLWESKLFGAAGLAQRRGAAGGTELASDASSDTRSVNAYASACIPPGSTSNRREIRGGRSLLMTCRTVPQKLSTNLPYCRMIIRQRGKPSPLLGASGPGGFVAIVARRKTAALLLPRQAAFHLLSCDASDSRADARLAATRSRCFNYRASYPRIDGGRSPLVRLFYTNTTLTTMCSMGLLLRLKITEGSAPRREVTLAAAAVSHSRRKRQRPTIPI